MTRWYSYRRATLNPIPDLHSLLIVDAPFKITLIARDIGLYLQSSWTLLFQRLPRGIRVLDYAPCRPSWFLSHSHDDRCSLEILTDSRSPVGYADLSFDGDTASVLAASRSFAT